MPALASSRADRASFVYNAVAVGSSAGGLYSLGNMLDALPVEFRCPIVVVQHLSPEYKSMMADILGRRSALRVEEAIDRAPVRPGMVYIGAPAVHLVVDKGLMRFRFSPPVKHQRPSINMMFESVAAFYKDSAIGIILSGTGSDGAEGISAIKAAGGYTIAEDPTSAKFNGMPKAAIATGSVDRIAASKDIGRVIFELSRLRRSVDKIVHG